MVFTLGSSVVVRLAGGLGNQMFQYAMGRALAERHGARLCVDRWSGFAQDRRYRRTYQLGRLPIVATELSGWSALAALGNAWYLWNRALAPGSQVSWVYRPTRRTTLITERGQYFNASVMDADLARTCWTDGYWQSPRYFAEIAEKIATELQPPRPQSHSWRSAGEQMASQDSVAVGIRLYEETQRPGDHARDGKQKTTADIQGALARQLDASPRSHVYVFCTHRAPLLDQMVWPTKTTFITNDSGRHGTLDTLWLMSQCRHHVITNSTFYWWGAWLSSMKWVEQGHRIFAADNFINRDTLPSNWVSF